MQELSKTDAQWLTRRCPAKVLELLKQWPRQLFVAGGFIRSCVSNEDISDIDIFAATKELAKEAALKFAGEKYETVTSKNAYTVLSRPIVTQFIHRWTYTTPVELLKSFDFTIASAALWYDGKWCTMCHDNFYQDMAGKRLVYMKPIREEEAGGSMLRVLKFYRKGYRIPLKSLADVMARMCVKVKVEKVGNDADAWAHILNGMLQEVDPNIASSNIAYIADDEEQTQFAGESI